MTLISFKKLKGEINNHAGVYFIFFALISCEWHQYYLINKTKLLTGDFVMPLGGHEDLFVSAIISTFNWCLLFAIYKFTEKKSSPKLTISVTNLILLIYILNLVFTVVGGVGNVLAESKNAFSFFTTMIPISYLILVNAQAKKLEKNFYVAAVIIALIDLSRLLLGAFLKLGYIYLMKVKMRGVILLFVTSPLFIYPVIQLVEYKFESRGVELSEIEINFLEVITSRISILPTVHFVRQNAQELSGFCNSQDYSSPWLAAGLSLVPKTIFGLEWVKTYNNCFIEYHLSRQVNDSSVNAPWILSLYLEYKYSTEDFLAYLFFTASLFAAIIFMCNYLFGAEGSILKLWIMFEFIWSGNILSLSIPIYFLLLISAYYFLKKNYPAQVKFK